MLMLHIHGDPVSGITLPSPDLIASMYDRLPQDLQKQTEGYLDALNQIIEELNTIRIPNKTKYILSKNVFTT